MKKSGEFNLVYVFHPKIRADVISVFRRMAEPGFRDEDWMDLPREEGHDVISPPRVTIIPRATAALTISLEEEEPEIPEASRIRSPLRTETVASASTPSQPTYLLPSSIRSKIVAVDLERIRTIYGIPEEYQLRVPHKRERADWKSPGWVCFYEVAFAAGFRFPFPNLIRQFFAYFGISPSQVLPNVWRTLLAVLVLSKSSNVDFGLADLLFSYFLKEHDSEKGRYTLYRRRGREHLIVELSTFDKMWKNDYFFISDDCLENREGEPQIPYA